ncbi:MAG: T9SS type A sorting domain-containing protein [Chitinophagales bacterium]|nr:T9SS type A sorting domain-containing protein [Chitinophagales bacterium]
MSCQQLTLSPNDITTISKDEVQIAIYPNPTRDYSLLEVNKTGNAIHYEWQILNSIGQLIEKGLGTTSKGTDLAVHHLADGVYWIRVYMSGQVASIKMVKVK